MNLKFALRNIRKRPFLNLIKVIGLALALTGVLLIALFLENELSYDRFHQRSDRLYRFTLENRIAGQHFARVYRPAYIPDFAEYCAGIESFLRLVPIRGGVLKQEEDIVSVEQGFLCDSTFFDLFDATLITGDPDDVLDAPGSMVVSESFAKRTFGQESPIGQTLVRPQGQYYSNEAIFTVKGVMEDFPQNSHFHPDLIVSRANEKAFNSWAWTYLLLSESTNSEQIEKDFKSFFTSLGGEEAAEKTHPHLQNITDIHLHSHKLREIEPNSNVSVVYTFFIAAGILMLIALINYANLNIGMAGFSDRYLFISRTFGAALRQHLKYFLTESVVLLGASLVVAGFIVALGRHIIRNHFGLDLLAGNGPWVIAIVLIFSFLVLFSGVLPVTRHAVRYLKSSAGYRKQATLKDKGLSKPLLVLQYAFSVALIVAVIIIHKQTSYALENRMGAGTGSLICLEKVHSNVQKRFDVFKSELRKYPSIESVSAMMEELGGEINDRMQFTMEGYQVDESDIMSGWLTVMPCDYSFASIFDLSFLAGEDFSRSNKDHEGLGEYIINEAAMQKLGYMNPSEIIGKEFKLNFGRGPITIPRGQIIGVVEDFHFSSLKREIQPMVMFKRENLWLMNFIIAYRPGRREEAVSALQEVWGNLYPEYPLKYQYVSSMYKNVYKAELTQARLLSLFTFIALFICSMGLLGMSLLLTRRREKEIGIRKVHGAHGREIIRMLNWQLIRWIVISSMLAVPLALFAMNKWLENFAYRTALSWWIFLVAGLAAIVISLLTVSFYSWRAASSSPVEVLRDE